MHFRFDLEKAALVILGIGMLGGVAFSIAVLFMAR